MRSLCRFLLRAASEPHPWDGSDRCRTTRGRDQLACREVRSSAWDVCQKGYGCSKGPSKCSALEYRAAGRAGATSSAHATSFRSAHL